MAAFSQRIADLNAFHDALDNANGFGFLILVDEDAGGRNAALAGIDPDARDRRRQRRLKVGTRQDEVGGLAAQFLMDALDGIGGRLGDHDARTGGTGEADHVDVRMRGDRFAHGQAIALDEVEDTGGYAGCIHDFGKDRRVTGAFFRWLQDHCVAGGKAWRDLQRDLVERPVPRRDEADNAHGFVYNLGGTGLFGEVEGLQRFQRAHEAADASANLCGRGEAQWRAHFVRHGGREITGALLILFNDTLH